MSGHTPVCQAPHGLQHVPGLGPRSFRVPGRTRCSLRPASQRPKTSAGTEGSRRGLVWPSRVRESVRVEFSLQWVKGRVGCRGEGHRSGVAVSAYGHTGPSQSVSSSTTSHLTASEGAETESKLSPSSGVHQCQPKFVGIDQRRLGG